MREFGLLLSLIAFSMKWIEHRTQSDLKTCESNLKTIAFACEWYSIEHAGHYPVTLDRLGTEIFNCLPQCPAAPTGTSCYGYVPSRNPDRFTLTCQGNHHRNAGLEPNQPQRLSADNIVYPH